MAMLCLGRPLAQKFRGNSVGHSMINRLYSSSRFCCVSEGRVSAAVSRGSAGDGGSGRVQKKGIELAPPKVTDGMAVLSV